MRAVNLHLLTRVHEHQMVSMLLEALSGREDGKEISPHEAATLWSLTDRIAAYLMERDTLIGDGWVRLLDGFFFSYVIEHIGKEFDLLKVSADGGCILNIELKSEKVGEERILRQLQQNRYYLSHVAHTIYSFTYVMETDLLYVCDDAGELRQCEFRELAEVLAKDVFQDYLPEGIGNLFRTAEYLISPIADPEKFLKGKYFLTNQQADFKRRIVSELAKVVESDGRNPVDGVNPAGSKNEVDSVSPVISVSGIAGTGKTLLLLDIAKELSEKQKVLFIHSGPLRKGHIEISRNLEGVDIVSIEQFYPDGSSLNSSFPSDIFSGYGFAMVDEADHLEVNVLDRLFADAGARQVPVILSYDPHHLLLPEDECRTDGSEPSDAAELIGRVSTLSLAFTGNIRINRPVYSFLRTLLYLRERAARADYSCIDVLFAETPEEQKLTEDYYREKGYVLVSRSDGAEKEVDIIAREYDRVMMILDESFYYDETLHLRSRKEEEEALRLLYEGLSRTRENLCLLVTGNRELFRRVLAIRLNR